MDKQQETSPTTAKSVENLEVKDAQVIFTNVWNELEAEFSTEDEVIINAVDVLKKLYETPTSRAYRGIKTMLDRLADYMENTPIEHGRDGNINSLVNAAAKYQQIRESFKGAFRDLKDEQQSSVRGGQSLAYDQ